MSLIRCHGKIHIPKTYKTFFEQQLAIFSAVPFLKARPERLWHQCVLANPNDISLQDIHDTQLEDEDLGITRIQRNTRLTNHLRKYGSGYQEHNLMTVFETDEHHDDCKMLSQALVIPVQLDHRHKLSVGKDIKKLKVGHVYSFNQMNMHCLYLDDKTIPFSDIEYKPAQLIVVGYYKSKRDMQ